MKLHKQLLINGQPIALINDDIALHLFMPGTASFTVKSSQPLTGIVQYALGYDHTALVPFFTGFIYSSNAIDGVQHSVLCRELGATLNRPITLSLRAPTLQNLLQSVAGETGLNFITPPTDYANTATPRIDHHGNGYHLMDSLSDTFGINQLIWQQQGDNTYFVGSWADSFWASRPTTLAAKWQSTVSKSGGARVPVLPRLRPGARINNQYLTSLRLAGNNCDLTWHPNPWGNH